MHCVHGTKAAPARPDRASGRTEQHKCAKLKIRHFYCPALGTGTVVDNKNALFCIWENRKPSCFRKRRGSPGKMLQGPLGGKRHPSFHRHFFFARVNFKQRSPMLGHQVLKHRHSLFRQNEFQIAVPHAGPPGTEAKSSVILLRGNNNQEYAHMLRNTHTHLCPPVDAALCFLCV